MELFWVFCNIDVIMTTQTEGMKQRLSILSLNKSKEVTSSLYIRKVYKINKVILKLKRYLINSGGADRPVSEADLLSACSFLN